MKKSFTINEKGNSIRCLMYYADIKAVRRAVICAHGFGGNELRVRSRHVLRFLQRYL